MSGTDKLPLLVIGKSKNPIWFKNIKNILVDYDVNKTAWMTSEIFTTLVKKLDKRMVMQHKQICLIKPAHPNIDGLKSVKIIFLPPNTTTHTQPMDQGVIRHLTCHFLEAACRWSTQTPCCLYWNRNQNQRSRCHRNDAKCLTTTIDICSRHAGFVTDIVDVQKTDSDDIPLAVLGRLANRVTFDQFATADEHLPVCDNISDRDIVNNLLTQRPTRQKMRWRRRRWCWASTTPCEHSWRSYRSRQSSWLHWPVWTLERHRRKKCSA